MTPRSLIEPARLAGSALLHTQTDERLVDLTRAGNSRAFEAIVARYRKPLLRYCRGVLPPDRAEDAVQQAFLNAYKAIGAGEAELKLRPWLYRVAHNASLNLLRQNGWDHDQIPEDFDGVIQPPQAVEQKEHIRELVRAVKDLPERQRDAMILRELEGRSYEEISLALGVSGGAVRQLLNRARTTLRAAATAITPPQIVERLVERAAVDAPTAGRIAEIAAGAGGAASLTKFGTALVVAGAVAGGVAVAPPHHSAHHNHGATDAAEAAKLALRGAGLDPSAGPGHPAVAGGAGGRRVSGRIALALALTGGKHGGGRSGSGSQGGRSTGTDGHVVAGDHHGGSDSHGGRSGHGGDGSGHGGDGSGDGSHSGPGSGSDPSSSGSSGDGSGGSDHSGHGSGGGGHPDDSGDTTPSGSGPSVPPPTGSDTGTGGSDKTSPDDPPDPPEPPHN